MESLPGSVVLNTAAATRRGIVGCLLLPVWCGFAGGGPKQPAAANGSLLFHAPNLEKPTVDFLSDGVAIK